MNPVNDRKRFYTDEKLELFVDYFIEGFRDEWLGLKLGEYMAKQKVNNGFIVKEENNLLNIELCVKTH